HRVLLLIRDLLGPSKLACSRLAKAHPHEHESVRRACPRSGALRRATLAELERLERALHEAQRLAVFEPEPCVLVMQPREQLDLVALRTGPRAIDVTLRLRASDRERRPGRRANAADRHADAEREKSSLEHRGGALRISPRLVHPCEPPEKR